MSTGIKYLDKVLGGYPDHNVLVEHDSGAGGTLLGLHYLLGGMREGENVGALVAGASANNLIKKLTAIGLGRDNIVYAGPEPEDFFRTIHERKRTQKECFDRLLIDSLSHIFMESGLGGVDPEVCSNSVKLKDFLADRLLSWEKHCGHVMALIHHKMVHPEVMLFLEESFEGVLRLEMTGGRKRVMKIIRWPWDVKKKTLYYSITEKGFVFK